jgi:ElaB/YqjD/DUF883 family membrane-anchored ribosome-binding protein
MSEKNGSAPEKPDAEALRAEIKQTRAELGETVQALAAKADVKARAKEQVEQTKQRVRAQVEQATNRVRGTAQQAVHTVADTAHDAGENAKRDPVPWLAAAAAGAVLVVVFLVIRGRRR